MRHKFEFSYRQFEFTVTQKYDIAILDHHLYDPANWPGQNQKTMIIFWIDSSQILSRFQPRFWTVLARFGSDSGQFLAHFQPDYTSVSIRFWLDSSQMLALLRPGFWLGYVQILSRLQQPGSGSIPARLSLDFALLPEFWPDSGTITVPAWGLKSQMNIGRKT